jgi:hypothetical protein
MATISSATPTVTPTPTDAVIYLAGHVSQPANPVFFVTMDEAQALKNDLVANSICPGSAKIVDVSYALGPIVYGVDGRYVLGFNWNEVDDVGDGQQSQVLWEVFAGLLYWRWKELPAGKWRKTAGGSIWRY